MSSQAEPSWCRITTGSTAEATFSFTIDNFKNRPEKVKESLKSTCFTVNGPEELKTKWELEIYPKGNKGNGDWISVYLSSKEDFKVNAKFELHVVDGAGVERETQKSKAYEFNGSNCGVTKSLCNCGVIGWSGFLKWDQIEDQPDLLPNGSFTIKCRVTVFGPERVLSGSDNDSGSSDLLLKTQSQNQLSEQLGNLFIDKQLSDFRIECEGQTFDCHQAILAARSPVFMAMFQSNMKEKETKRVTIDDFKSEVVSEMLHFIYTGNVTDKVIGEVATELLAAADKYQLELLKNICEERLCSTLEVTNCLKYFVVGDMNQTVKLRKMALKLAADNVDSIIDTDVFKELFKQHPVLAWEVMKAQNEK